MPSEIRTSQESLGSPLALKYLIAVFQIGIIEFPALHMMVMLEAGLHSARQVPQLGDDDQ